MRIPSMLEGPAAKKQLWVTDLESDLMCSMEPEKAGPVKKYAPKEEAPMCRAEAERARSKLSVGFY